MRQIHLAPVYTWMMGGADERLAWSRRFFAAHGIAPGRQRAALDLGAGSGFQSIPLAELGFSVTAVDLSATLLAELRERAGGLAVRTVERDFLPVTDMVDQQQDLVVCMGDTLTHLADHPAIEALVAGSARVLARGGRLLLNWRDLGRPPGGDARFLPVRSTPTRIFTCFLEELDDERVRVTDIVHERRGDGFVQRVGSYLKLRIAPSYVDGLLAKHGFTVDHAGVEAGFAVRVATI
jgi:SAM-dependent methyltransferase